jgi:lysophospholipase L1-like esterase
MRPILLVPVALFVALTLACGSDGDDAASSDPPSARPTRTPSGAAAATPTFDAAAFPNSPLYIALGDSLSAGAGASDRTRTAFVPLVHEGLGPDVGLLNLGHSGDDSFEIRDHGHLQQALELIEGRNGDADPDNDVTLVTLEIGGNDLLDIFFDLVIPGTCPNVEEGLKKPECVEAFRAALDNFRPHLHDILADLHEADPELNLVLMTLYNPFSGSTVNAFEPIGDLGLEGKAGTEFPEGLNDVVRDEGEEAGVTVVELYAPFFGKAQDYISRDLIHPNDAGYRVMADAVLDAAEGLR